MLLFDDGAHCPMWMVHRDVALAHQTRTLRRTGLVVLESALHADEPMMLPRAMRAPAAHRPHSVHANVCR